MWKRSELIGSLGVAALLGACADPGSVAAPLDAALSIVPGPRVSGSGHVQTAVGLREFTFHAVQAPDGDVEGSFKVVLPNGLFFEAEVTCMSVVGNTGWVAGTIRTTNAGAVIVGSGSMFYATDNGEGGGIADVVSIAAFNAAAGADLAFCANRPLALPPLTVTNGNVQVR